MNESSFELNVADVRRVFDRAAAHYDDAAAVQREIGQRLLERLDYLRITPELVVDLGCGTGFALDDLRKRYPAARLLGVDVSESMLHRARKRGRWFKRPGVLAADACALPLADDSVDLIYSNLMLPWCSQQDRVWGEISRVLRPGGALLFTSLGPDTLIELRTAVHSAGSVEPRIHPFIDMHDIGDALIRHRIAEPVMDAEKINVEYPSLDALLDELRQTGSVNVLAARSRGLVGITRQAINCAYAKMHEDERISATVEVAYGHGWAAQNAAEISVAAESFVSFSSLRKSLQKTKP